MRREIPVDLVPEGAARARGGRRLLRGERGDRGRVDDRRAGRAQIGERPIERAQDVRIGGCRVEGGTQHADARALQAIAIERLQVVHGQVPIRGRGRGIFGV